MARKLAKKLDQKQIKALIKQAKGGDARAFGQLFNYFSDDIFRFAYFKVSSKEKAQDITSETFLRVWRYLDRYKSNNFKSYIYTIARNLIIDHYKSKRYQTTTLLDDFSWIEADNKALTKELISQERQEKLHQAISQLSDNYQEVIILRFIEELSVKETAKIVDKSQVAVRVAQHRALKKLKKILEINE